MTAILDIKNLSVRLGGRPVLDNVSLHVTAGELTGLLGPNGAGKTTLLRAILGLLPSAAGSINLNGKPVRLRDSPIGYVPQKHDFAWDFPINVEQVVLSGRTGRLGLLRRPAVADWQAVGQALERTGLAELRHRPVGQLSGGQRQRVLVARALAVQPILLLLDEPFTGLDMPAQDSLTELFAALTAEGHAIVMSTHDLPSAQHTCTGLILLNRTIVAAAPPAQLHDAQPWMDTFGVTATSPLLKALNLTTETAA